MLPRIAIFLFMTPVIAIDRRCPPDIIERFSKPILIGAGQDVPRMSLAEMGQTEAAQVVTKMAPRLAEVQQLASHGSWSEALKILESETFVDGLGINEIKLFDEVTPITEKRADQLLGDSAQLQEFMDAELAKKSWNHFVATEGKTKVIVPRIIVNSKSPPHPAQLEFDRERTRLILEEFGHHLQKARLRAGQIPFLSRPFQDQEFRRLFQTRLVEILNRTTPTVPEGPQRNEYLVNQAREADIYLHLLDRLGPENIPERWRDRYLGRRLAMALFNRQPIGRPTPN